MEECLQIVGVTWALSRLILALTLTVNPNSSSLWYSYVHFYMHQRREQVPSRLVCGQAGVLKAPEQD